MYYKSMLRSIKLFIKSGEFASVVSYVKALNAEVKLSDKEKRDLNELLRLIVIRLFKEGKSAQKIAGELDIDLATTKRIITNFSEESKRKESVETGLER